MPIAESPASMKTILLAAFAISAAARNVQAATAAKQMHVSVEVVARTILTVNHAPATVQVTAADVARGFVDLTERVVFSVKSNARDGYRIEFQPIRGPFTRAQVQWENTIVSVGSDASWIVRQFHNETQTSAMNVRLIVPRDTEPGTYEFPLAFDADSI